MSEVDPRSQSACLLVVEDEESLWKALDRLMPARWSIRFAKSAEEALEIARQAGAGFDAALLDIGLPGMDGLECLPRLRDIAPDLPVLMVTGRADPATIVRGIRGGAFDYVTKPFRPEELLHRISRAIESRRQARRLEVLEADDYLQARMGPSQAIGDLAQMVGRVAPTDLPVLVEGESGTGKELVSRRIHALSKRSGGPFVAVDCGAIPESLIESEFFGFRKGSFTGADRDRNGKLFAASGGTLFLDEIANLPLSMQAKLLRVIQEQEVTPLGARQAIPIDLRILSATNRSLKEQVDAGEFRLDLFHRIATFPLVIPPLRDRREDLLFLARRFLREATEEFGREVDGFGQEAADEIVSHSWPGNARELQGAIRRAALMSEGPIETLGLGTSSPRAKEVSVIETSDHFLIQVEAVISKAAIAGGCLPFKSMTRYLGGEFEKEIVRCVLNEVDGNKSQASRVLGIDYKTLHKKARSLE